ncbi:hypothetical protein [Flavobacterium alkalisoli]|uniref:hypothetical protein n=1 Tax=Flavobacterium alkalisoli TaxID=2602769 RepID=UPI003A8D5364
MKKILPAFSYIFHPLFISVYAALFYLLISHRYFYGYEIVLISVQVLILTVLLPVCVYYLLNSLGLIHSKIHLDKKERKIPLAIQAILLFILIKQGFGNVTIQELHYYFTGYLISTLIALLCILLGYKASLHMMGVTSITIFVISISAYYSLPMSAIIAFFILCCGFTASSRLVMKAHTMDELILGSLIGILPQIGLWYMWLLPSL